MVRRKGIALYIAILALLTGCDQSTSGHDPKGDVMVLAHQAARTMQSHPPQNTFNAINSRVPPFNNPKIHVWVYDLNMKVQASTDPKAFQSGIDVHKALKGATSARRGSSDWIKIPASGTTYKCFYRLVLASNRQHYVVISGSPLSSF